MWAVAFRGPSGIPPDADTQDDDVRQRLSEISARPVLGSRRRSPPAEPLAPAAEGVMRVLRLLRLRSSADVEAEHGRGRERYRRIFLTLAASFLSRGVGMTISLVMVPLIVGYLGKETYGLWAAITALIAWAALFEFGIINGLVNAVSEAYGRDDRAAAGRYVSTAFFLLCGISAVLAAMLLVVVPWVGWQSLFGAEGVVESTTVRYAVLAAALCFLVGMPLSVVRQIYAGYQAGYVTNMVTAVGSVLTLGGVVLAIHWQASLPVLILVYGGAHLLLQAVNLAVVTRLRMPWLRLSLAQFSRGAVRRLSATSVPLFLFQVGALMLHHTQLIILARRTSLDLVAEYALLMHVFFAFYSFIDLSSISFRPTFREAYERQEHGWMRSSFRRMLGLQLAMAVMVSGLLIMAGNPLMEFWLRRTDIGYSATVWVCVGLMVIVTTWVSAYTDLLTILDRIWILVPPMLVNGLITTGLTFWLAPTYGVLGAVLSFACFNVLCGIWLMPLLARRFLSARRDEASPPSDGRGWLPKRFRGRIRGAPVRPA
jgi:O-antigen/teichoic acid export membrane protein